MDPGGGPVSVAQRIKGWGDEGGRVFCQQRVECSRELAAPARPRPPECSGGSWPTAARQRERRVPDCVFGLLLRTW